MEKQENSQYGWICPRCDKVNAPWSKQCDCKSISEKHEPYLNHPFWTPYPMSGDYMVNCIYRYL